MVQTTGNWHLTILFSPDRPELSLGFSLWRLCNFWQQAINVVLKELDLTHVQYLMLGGVHHLQANNAVVNQNKLAKHLKTDIMMTSKVCRALEKKGYLLRAKLRSDSRSRMLVLTRKGKERYTSAVLLVETVERKVFNHLQIPAGEWLDQIKALMLHLLPESEPVEHAANVFLIEPDLQQA